MRFRSRVVGVVLGRKRASAVLLAGTLAAGASVGCASRTDDADNPSAGPAGVCATCHLPEYQATRHPLHRGVKPTTCGTCHATESWHPSAIRHAWPLTGAHATGSCFSCHEGDPPTFLGTAKECVGCHRKDYDTSPFPGHSRFPTTCADCHSTTAWKPTVEHTMPALVFPEEPPAAPSPKTGSREASPPAKIAPSPTARAPSWPMPQPRAKTPPAPTTPVPSWPTPPPTVTAPPRTAPPPDTVSGASRRRPK